MRDAKRITIVGGTSAWMTAALLLNNITKDTTISLIDKTDGGNPVGVGEATILSFKHSWMIVDFHSENGLVR